MYGEIEKALRLPEIKEKLAGIDVEPVGSSPEEAAKRIREESERWAPVVKKIGLKLD